MKTKLMKRIGCFLMAMFVVSFSYGSSVYVAGAAQNEEDLSLNSGSAATDDEQLDAAGKRANELNKTNRRDVLKTKGDEKVADQGSASNDQSADPSSSFASNYSLGIGAEVNAQTGQLSLNFSNIKLAGVSKDVDVNLGIVKVAEKNSAAKSMFNLPCGWKFNIDYVDNGQVLCANSQSYVVDPFFKGADGYKSGLKHITSHALKFEKFTDAQTLKYDDSVKYTYLFSTYSGSHEYFDADGKLVCVDDLFGNHVMYQYEQLYKGAKFNVFNARLSSITDSYGQKITVSDNGGVPCNTVTVTMPDGRTSVYSWNPDGKSIKVTDLTGRSATIWLNRMDGSVSSITYPTGGSVEYKYNETAIPYHMGDSSQTAYLKGISHVYQKAGNNSPDLVTAYNYALNGSQSASFMGPNYVPNTDALMTTEEPNVRNSYRYTTEVRQQVSDANGGDIITHQTFNFLHVPVATEVFKKDVNTLKSKVASDYIGQDAYGNFPAYNALKPNYNLPALTTSHTYGDSSNADRVHTVKTDYNALDQPISVVQNTNGKVTAEKTTEYFGPEGFGQISKETVKDYVDGPDCKTITITESVNTLSDDKKFVAVSEVTKMTPPSNDAVPTSVKCVRSDVDSMGRVILSSLEGKGNFNLAESPSSITTKNEYALDGSNLTVTTIDALGNRSSKKVDIRNGSVLSETDALGNSVAYEYSNSYLTVKKVYPDGSWEMTDNSSNPNVIEKTASNGKKVKQVIDGLGRVVEEYDNQGPTNDYRLVKTTKYNELGKVAEETDVVFNHTTKHVYNDWQGRETLTVDYLGNTKRIDYNDYELTATEYYNDIKSARSTYDDNGNVTKTESFLEGKVNSSKTPVSDTTYNGKKEEIATKLTIADEGATNVAPVVSSTSAYDTDGKTIAYNLSTDDGVKAISTWRRSLLGDTIQRTTRFDNAPAWIVAPDGKSAAGVTMLSETKMYDAAGRLSKLANQVGQEIAYTYNANNKMTSMTDFSGNTFNYTYDCMGNMLTMKGPGVIQTNVYYGSNEGAASGQIKSRTVTYGDRSNTVSYTYNKYGVESITQNGKAMTVAYDSNFDRVKSMTDYAGKATNFEYYDYTSNIKTISNPEGSVTYTYYSKADDALFGSGDVMKQAQYSNGVTVNYEYVGSKSSKNGANEEKRKAPKLKSIKTCNSDGALISGSFYDDYDDQGNVTQLSQKSDLHSSDNNCNNMRKFAYDDMGHLVKEETYVTTGVAPVLQMTTSFVFDINGNIMSKVISESNGKKAVTTYTYGAEKDGVKYYNKGGQYYGDLLLDYTEKEGDDSGVKTEMDYDNNGNMLWIKTGGVIVQSFAYDKNNMLVEYKDNEGSDVCYEYNAEALRSKKYYKDNPDKFIEFFYSPSGEIVNEIDASGDMSSYLMAGTSRACRTINHGGKAVSTEWYIMNGKDVVGTTKTDASGKASDDMYKYYTAYGEDKNLNQ